MAKTILIDFRDWIRNLHYFNMIDYTKVNSLPVAYTDILAHEQLTFPMSNVATTGEMLNRAQVAHYGMMECVAKGGHTKLKGSYHKHAQSGTNHMEN